jgi:hypothetical protein
LLLFSWLLCLLGSVVVHHWELDGWEVNLNASLMGPSAWRGLRIIGSLLSRRLCCLGLFFLWADV